MSLPHSAAGPASNSSATWRSGCATGNTNSTRCGKFLSNTRTFFSNLWNYRLSIGSGLANITGGLLIIFLIDLPTLFGSEIVTQGLPFFMIGAGITQVVSAFAKAAAETRNFIPPAGGLVTGKAPLPNIPVVSVRPGKPGCEICEDDDSPFTGYSPYQFSSANNQASTAPPPNVAPVDSRDSSTSSSSSSTVSAVAPSLPTVVPQPSSPAVSPPAQVEPLGGNDLTLSIVEDQPALIKRL